MFTEMRQHKHVSLFFTVGYFSLSSHDWMVNFFCTGMAWQVMALMGGVFDVGDRFWPVSDERRCRP